MKKRIISFLMALVMAVSLLPVQVFAEAVDAAAEQPVLEQQQEQQQQQEQKQEEKQEDTPVQEPVQEPQQSDEIEAAGAQVYAAGEPSVNFSYMPEASDAKVIGTYQVDENTTWNVRLITVDSTQYNYVTTLNSKIGVISTVKPATGEVLPLADRIGSHYKNSEVYEAGALLYTQLKDSLRLTDELNTDATQTCFYNFKYNSRAKKVTEVYGLLIIQWTAGELVMPDKTALQAAIDAAPKADDGTYYTKNDRYNGKTDAVNKNGFWADYQKVLQQAESVNNDDCSKQAAVDAATAALQAAIDNLIPTSRVNATALYEVLNTKWCWYGADHMLSTAGDPVSADNCTPLSWQPYAKAVKDGQALLEQLYKDGKPTDENTASKQGEVDKLAAAADVHKLVNKEAYAAAYDKYMAAKPEAEALLKQYDPAKLKESDYTADSWTAYTDAYAVLKTDHRGLENAPGLQRLLCIQ